MFLIFIFTIRRKIYIYKHLFNQVSAILIFEFSKSWQHWVGGTDKVVKFLPAFVHFTVGFQYVVCFCQFFMQNKESPELKITSLMRYASFRLLQARMQIYVHLYAVPKLSTIMRIAFV